MAPDSFFETAVIDGLEFATAAELRHRFGQDVRLLHPPERYPGTLQFTYDGSPYHLFQLRTILSLFWVERFPIPRPRALMGHQHLQRLLARIAAVRALNPKDSFNTLYLAAAGAESSVLARFVDELARETGLAAASTEGDLLVRLRRPLDGSPGWETAVRMAPRPLSVRPWRVCDRKGALNAAAAQVMVQLSLPRSEDIFLNIACGSGTLLIERAASAPARLIVGCDTDPAALKCAQANAQESRQGRRIHLADWDAQALPLASNSIDVVCADLPFGHDIGSHLENMALYPSLLAEAARVAKPGARGLFLTHEVHLIEEVLANSAAWVIERIIPIALAGLHPRIYLLRVNPGKRPGTVPGPS